LSIWSFHRFCFYRFLFATGQQLLEATFASIRLTILTLRRGILVLFFGRVDIFTGMAKAGFVITLIALHEDECASLLPRLEKSRKINIGRSKMGRHERSTISLELLQRNFCGVCGAET
jgi:hypothetical protein